jgi:hypothetical protein
LIGLGIALLALPSGIEGPVLLPISPGHAIAALDAAGVLPMVAGSCWLYAGLWHRRERLYRTAAASPRFAIAALLVAGFGLGLLVASVFSTFFWWWAVGAAAFGVVLVAVSIAAARE